MQDPGLMNVDDERYYCRRCQTVFTDSQFAPSLPVELGDMGLPVHVGVCFICCNAVRAEEMEDIMSEIRRQESWDRIERSIDQKIALNFPGKRESRAEPAAHVCHPPEAKTDDWSSNDWKCECGMKWRKPPWYSAYQPVNE